MGFNRRKMKDQRRGAAEKEAASRRATEAQFLEDAEQLIAAWNERQTKRMPMLFSPTVGAAIAARHWFLWVRCAERAAMTSQKIAGKSEPPVEFGLSIRGKCFDSMTPITNRQANAAGKCQMVG